MCCSPGGEQTRNLVLTGVYGNALAVRFRFSDFQTSVTFSFHFALQLSHLRFEELDAVVFRFAVCVQLSHFDTVIALQLSNLRFGISISLTECRGTRFFIGFKANTQMSTATLTKMNAVINFGPAIMFLMAAVLFALNGMTNELGRENEEKLKEKMVE